MEISTGLMLILFFAVILVLALFLNRGRTTQSRTTEPHSASSYPPGMAESEKDTTETGRYRVKQMLAKQEAKEAAHSKANPRQSDDEEILPDPFDKK